MAGLVYTAIYGDYETPKMQKHEDGYEHRNYHSLHPSLDPLTEARRIKVMEPSDRYNDFDWYLWLDGSMEITAPIMPLVENLLASEHDFAAFKHNEFTCAYQEIDACIERKKDSRENLESMRREISLRHSPKFPKNFGQAATGVLWRRNTMLVRDHARDWWEDIEEFTLRDQCSFMFNLWKRDAYIEWIPGSHLKNKWFKYHRGHK